MDFEEEKDFYEEIIFDVSPDNVRRLKGRLVGLCKSEAVRSLDEITEALTEICLCNDSVSPEEVREAAKRIADGPTTFSYGKKELIIFALENKKGYEQRYGILVYQDRLAA